MMTERLWLAAVRCAWHPSPSATKAGGKLPKSGGAAAKFGKFFQLSGFPRWLRPAAS